jgi:hypothetical protein
MMLQWIVIVGLVAVSIWRVVVHFRREGGASTVRCADCPLNHGSLK